MLFSLQVLFFRLLMSFLKIIIVFVPAPKPTVYSGSGSAQKMCSSISHFGATKVLIVTDEMLVKLDIIKPVTDELDSLGMEYTIFAEIQPDPTYDAVEKGVQIGLDQKCDAVLGIGGGSPLDAAKVIAARLTNAEPISKLVGMLKIKKPCLPLFVIPTTAGTGTETTIAAVVSDPETNKKTPIIDPKLVPIAAALDSSLMLSLPPHITAATGMDALTHGIESYLSMHATPATDAYAKAAVKMIMKNLPLVFKDGNNVQAREAMALASFYAGAAFTKANLGYTHAIAHQYGVIYHTPHGLANAIVLPYILDYNLPASELRLAELAIALGLGQKGENTKVLAEKFIASIRQLCQDLSIPTTLEALKKDDIPRIATGALKEAHYLYPVPRYMNNNQCRSIVQNMLHK